MTISIPGSTKLSRTNSSNETIEIITGPEVYRPFLDTFWSLVPFFREYVELGTPDNYKVADFGAGGGQLGVFVKNRYPQTDVHLYEIDPAAEKYILANAELYNVDVSVNIMNVADITATGEFDAVISTPPFLPEVLKKLEWHGHHSADPENSIFGGYKGLEVISLFIEKSSQVLKSGGLLVQVHSYPQTAEVNSMLEAAGFTVKENIRLEPMKFELEEAAFTIAYKN